RPLPGGIDDHAPAGTACQLFEPGRDATLCLGWMAFDDGPVELLDEPAGKQRAKPAQGLWMAAEDEAAAGVAVETMSERRWVWQAKTQRIKAAFEIGTTAGAGMHGDPRGLVDDQYEPIAVEHTVGETPLTPPAERLLRRAAVRGFLPQTGHPL